MYFAAMASADRDAPVFVRMAANPLRWRLLTALAASDHRVRELVELLGQPQNLVSYHLRLLRRSELVTARRSSHDARDTYYHLDLDRCADALAATGLALHPALSPGPQPAAADGADRPRVLFACTGNSARSPVAEALLRHRLGNRVEVTSAGSHPRARMDPRAVRVLRERYGIDIGAQRPRGLEAVAGRRFDHLISLCDKVREVHTDVRGRPRPAHWSIPDPAAAGDGEDAGRSAFGQLAADVDTRIRHLIPVLARTTKPETQP
jgi:protein-tyrosine-phosphatase/DNA-binding transcriptional ArsR family regulator